MSPPETAVCQEVSQHFEQSQGANGDDFGRVLGLVERHLDVRLRAKVVHLVGLYERNGSVQRGAVEQVSVVQVQMCVLVRVTVQMVYPTRVQRRRAAYESVDVVALRQQQLR